MNPDIAPEGCDLTDTLPRTGTGYVDVLARAHLRMAWPELKERPGQPSTGRGRAPQAARRKTYESAG